MTTNKSPAESGYRWPAEWEPHAATWLTWPHAPDTWPGADRLNRVESAYAAMVGALCEHERVRILVEHDAREERARGVLVAAGIDPDRGIDFVGRLTIGDGAASTKVVVLGQAKCEAPGKPTNGMDVSRTVARLQRGWIGCYVTTSFFSRQSQEELAVDKYPLITVSGDRVVKELEQIAAESGVTVMELVRSIDDGYKERLKHRRPEEVLYI